MNGSKIGEDKGDGQQCTSRLMLWGGTLLQDFIEVRVSFYNQTFGGPRDTWQLTGMASSYLSNPTFGVALVAEMLGAGYTSIADIDAILMEVYYADSKFLIRFSDCVSDNNFPAINCCDYD